jgi:ABC-type enterobactin transport system permease subunit
MGNIVTGALTGVVLYVTDIILREAAPSGGLMEMFKFILQGMIVTAFVQAITVYSKKKNYIDNTTKKF